jgi:hypothetical protein
MLGSILTGNIALKLTVTYTVENEIVTLAFKNRKTMTKFRKRHILVLKTATINSCFENKILEHDLVYNRIFLAQQKAPTQFYQ